MKLDSHQHFWSYSAAEYPWIPVGSPLERDWLPQDLAVLQQSLGFAGSIAVQARQTWEESRWLLELAEKSPGVRGVVGWVDLRSAAVGSQLEIFAAHPKAVGVRHVVQDEPDDRFMLGSDFVRGISQLSAHGLTYDLLVFPEQLPAAIELVTKFPQQPFVLDHIAKPYIKEGILEPWASQIRELALRSNVYCKLSGMTTEADLDRWTASDLRPYLDITLDAFGSQRVMVGSDWPVCLLAADYARTMEVVIDYISRLTASEQAAVLGGNCARFYGV